MHQLLAMNASHSGIDATGRWSYRRYGELNGLIALGIDASFFDAFAAPFEADLGKRELDHLAH
ncbi:hypothetical protein [Bradyrhizobium sp. CCGUVB23]|uniref:hypothetical protein n=1 Tax=Bradyrhizobium sp. CCGUVB23 TaxID=2949630 RepID=UPI003531E20D